MRSKADTIRGLLKAQPFRKFRISTAHGSFFVFDPEYARVSPLKKEVIAYDKDSCFHHAAMQQIRAIRVLAGSRKPGKR